MTCVRFARTRPCPKPPPGRWAGPAYDAWTSSLDRAGYLAAVGTVRARIAAGEVYQVNVCRVLSAPLPEPVGPFGLATVLAAGNPAPYQGALVVPSRGVWIVSASPERFLQRVGEVVRSQPVKGTARPGAAMLDKDVAENVMITDMVRNELGRLAEVGSVEVPELLYADPHPGLVHLVSTVTARLSPGVGWAELLSLAPPASVTGAPRSTATRLIAEVEPVPRGPYCGVLGWIDADQRRGDLAVAIRTFWRAEERLHFGTGAGITWGSDPAAEWAETELKAARLVALASAGG